MAKLTIVFGVLLILLAVIGFVSTGSQHPTALIPGGFGLIFILFGVMANTPDSKKRMLWMHISVTVALLAFLGTIPADIDAFRLSRGLSSPIQSQYSKKLQCLCCVSSMYFSASVPSSMHV
jgi:hypothetical protein